VYLVTGPTCQALILLVDMDEVKVSVAVPESRQAVCFRDQRQGWIVAGKAKFISFLPKGGIKRGRKFLIQQPGAGTAVNLMALGTVINRNRSVQVGACGQNRGHVRYFPAWSIKLPVMALQAKRPRIVPEKVRISGCVGVMAVRALPDFRQSPMRGDGTFHCQTYVFVAAETEFPGGALQQVCPVGRMGIVAFQTTFANRFVYDRQLF
jgi:hypothetical protein